MVYLSLGNDRFDRFFQGILRADNFQRLDYLVGSQNPDVCIVNVFGQENAVHILKSVTTQYPNLIIIALMDDRQFDLMLEQFYEIGVVDCIAERHIHFALKPILTRETNSIRFKLAQDRLKTYSSALQKAVYAIDYPYILSVGGQVYKSRLALEFDAQSCVKKEGFYVIENDAKWIKEIKNGDKISVIVSQGVSDDFNVLKDEPEEGVSILKFIKIKKQVVKAAEDAAVYDAVKKLKEFDFTIVHKGLVVNGKFTAVTHDDATHTVFVSIPKQYITSMSSLSKDGAVIVVEDKAVRCELSIERDMLALRNFAFASLTFKKRENLRVEPSKKIIATVTSDDFSFEGAIIDISLKSIAVYTDFNLKKISPKQNVTVEFSLGGEKIAAEAVIFKTERIGEESPYMKKIPNLFEPNKYFAAVINYSLPAKEREAINRYLSFRQSEIVAEIKNHLS